MNEGGGRVNEGGGGSEQGKKLTKLEFKNILNNTCAHTLVHSL